MWRQFGISLPLSEFDASGISATSGRELKTPKHSPAGYDREPVVHSFIHDHHHDGRDRKFLPDGCKGEEYTGASSTGHSLYNCGSSCFQSAVLCYKYVYVQLWICMSWLEKSTSCDCYNREFIMILCLLQ
jgi:hypothetical protein